GLEIVKDVFEREAVLWAERQDDRVLSGGGLELEVEASAEPLAQRQPPRALQAAPERRVQDELHPPRLVEEALEHERLLRRDDTEDLLGRGEILDHLPGGGLGQTRDLRSEPSDRLARLGVETAREVFPQLRHLLGQLPRAARGLAE